MRIVLWMLLSVVSGTTETSSLIEAETFKLAEEGYEIVTSYIFGDQDDEDSLSLRSRDSSGFIELSFNGDWINIEKVRRPTRWSEDSKFCSVLLPAAVSDFIQRKIRVPVESLGGISVYNLADKPKSGCACYVGLMVKMGFNIVNDRTITDYHTFCSQCPTYGRLLNGMKPSNPRLPETNIYADLIIQMSRQYTQIQPLGYST